MTFQRFYSKSAAFDKYQADEGALSRRQYYQTMFIFVLSKLLIQNIHPSTTIKSRLLFTLSIGSIEKMT